MKVLALGSILVVVFTSAALGHTPDPFLFDEGRRLIFHGKINDAMEPEKTPQINVMENNIKKALNGEPIEKDFDPSIGCSIKWKT